MLSAEAFIFLDTVWLAKVLMPILNHKGTELCGDQEMFGDVATPRAGIRSACGG